MSPSPLFVYNAGGDQQETASVLALAWAEAALAQVEVVDRAERLHRAILNVLERMDYDTDEPPPDEHASFRTAWVANHTLIWMCGQLQGWLSKTFEDLPELGHEIGLRTWRNTLEHLNEASISESLASANPGIRRPQSIEQLGEVLVGNGGDGTMPRFASLKDIRSWIAPMLSDQ